MKSLPKPPRLTKTEIKQNFWLAIECDYIEHGVGPTDLAKKFQVSRRSVVRHAKDEGWEKKRTDFREVQDSLEKRRERDRSETYHERQQLMASTLQARFYRAMIEEQEKLNLPEGHNERLADSVLMIQERVSTLNAFSTAGQSVGYGPPEPPPPPQTDFKVIIHQTQISSRKFDPEDELDVAIEMEVDGEVFVPNLGLGEVGEE